jgi:NADH-quinone oxidoreductase subunit L
MAAILIYLLIGLPWLGALAVWLAGNRRPALQHGLAVAFSLSAAGVSLALLTFPGARPVIDLPFNEAFGPLTFVPDGLGVTLAAIAAAVGSLAVLFSVDTCAATNSSAAITSWC